MERVIPTAVPSTDWVGVLNVLDLKNLTLTATVNNTRTSGGKAIVLEALMAKFKTYEAMATAQTNEALRDLCKTRGIKGISTLSKQELVGNLLISNIHMYNGDQANPVTGIIRTAVFGDPEEKTEDIKTFVAKKMKQKNLELDLLPLEVKVKKNDKVKKAEKEKPAVEGVSKQDAAVAVTSPATTVVAPTTKVEVKEEVKEETKKMPIPKKVKTDIWNTFIGAQIPCHKCLCCLKATISNTDFHVGHVVSEFNGGNLNIDNLRPICASCNYSMGTSNLKDYVIKYGYFY
jgi:hypothetical protein